MNKSRSLKLQVPDVEGVTFLDYICVDHSKLNICNKTYVVDFEPKSVEDCPVKSMQQFDTPEKKDPCPELILKPEAMFRDPFRQGRHKLVLCDLEYDSGKSLAINTRIRLKTVLDQVAEQEPLFGLEQEYYFIDDDGVPMDWDFKVNDPCYDSNSELCRGRHTGFQRQLVDLHMKACLFAGLNVYGSNREESPGEWEYQLGPSSGLEVADQLHVSRYILWRIAEMHEMNITFWNPECARSTDSRSTLHVNFSTKQMRQDGGMAHIYRAVEKLARHPQEKLLPFYDLTNGEDATWRLSGTAPYMPRYDNFVCKVASKSGSSVRIPTQVHLAGKGYFEDRRPSSEACPYDVLRAFTTAALLDTNGF